MKVCITAETESIEGNMDSRFGRAPFLIVFDTDQEHVDVFKNPSLSQSGGAGGHTAQFLDSKDVKTVLTGHVGPNAVTALKAAGISVATGVTGTVKSVWGRFKSGELVSSPL